MLLPRYPDDNHPPTFSHPHEQAGGRTGHHPLEREGASYRQYLKSSSSSFFSSAPPSLCLGATTAPEPYHKPENELNHNDFPLYTYTSTLLLVLRVLRPMLSLLLLLSPLVSSFYHPPFLAAIPPLAPEPIWVRRGVSALERTIFYHKRPHTTANADRHRVECSQVARSLRSLRDND